MSTPSRAETSHPIEPWTTEHYDVMSGASGARIRSGDVTIVDIAYLPDGPWSKGQCDAAALRIAACVNACAGIDTARLIDFSLLEFRESAMNVIRNWDNGDLAGAVSNLHGDSERIGGTAEKETEMEPQGA